MTKKVFLAIIAIVFATNFTSFAQSKKKTKDQVKRMIWSSKDPAKKIKYNLADYQDKPGIIIYQKYYYNYNKRNKKVFFENYFRRRIKILDQATLNEYSDFKYQNEKYFSYYSSQGSKNLKGINYFNIVIIKKNGKKVRVNVEKNTVKEDGKNKLAIPNLEIGDIVDYYYYTYETFRAQIGYDFKPVTTSLNSRYPILKQEIDISIGKRFYLNFNNYNGAPDLKKIRSKNPKQDRYLITMSNIKPREAKNWVYNVLEYPTIKFQVHFSPSKSAKAYAFGFLNEGKSGLKKSVSKEEVLKAYKNSFKYSKSYKSYYSDFTGYAKKRIQNFYEFLRFDLYGKQYASYIYNKATGKEFYSSSMSKNISEDAKFISVMTDFLNRSNIKHDIVLMTKRYTGKIEDLLIKGDLNMFIRVFLKNGETLYIHTFNDNPIFGIAGELNPYYEGNTGYALTQGKKGVITNISKITIPASKPEKNKVTKDIHISFEEGLKRINFKKTLTAIGNIKRSYQNEVTNIFDIYKEEINKFNKNVDILPDKAGGRKKRNSIRNSYKSFGKELKKKNIKYLEKSAKETYEVKIDDYKYSIVHSGRYNNNPIFKYEESFVIKEGLTKKAGRNLILLAGKLIGYQLNIDKKEKERSENIYKKRTSTSVYNISIDIPKGYKVKGLNKLNKSVKNEVGSFISNAKIEGNKIVIHVEEKYNHLYEPNANWKKMVDILNTSYQFTQEKLLFKK